MLLALLPSCVALAESPQALLDSGKLRPEVGEQLINLTAPTAGMAQRREAAGLLIRMNSGDARRALVAAMDKQAPAACWTAVSQAVALEMRDPPRDLGGPMLEMLLSTRDTDLQVQLAEALGRFEDSRLLKRMTDLAFDEDQSIDTRRPVIFTMGHHRTQKMAEQLLKLTQVNQREEVQDAAFDALIILTGLEENNRDRAAWALWWEQARRLSKTEWQEQITGNLIRRQAAGRIREQEIVERLLESQQALYRTTTPEDRPAVLAYMLRDALEPIRQLGMTLALQRLLDDQPFGEPLREALRGRLEDPSPSMRQRAVLLLRDLADDPAADRVAGRLEREEEHVLTVLRANLLMMARLPRSAAVEPALRLLAEDALRGEAAGALAAAVDANLLEKTQHNQAVKRLRQLLKNGRLPPPQVVTLLGKVGTDEDWDRIAWWIDSDDSSVKQAAAQAWADSQRSLKLLADRMSDPVIQPIVIIAATRRGEDPWTMRELAAHRPTRDQAVEAWQRALVAMAGRVEADALLEIVYRLESVGEPAPLLEQLLTAGIERPQSSQVPAAQLVGLLLKRGESRLATGNPATALADFALIVQSGAKLDETDHERLNRGRIRAGLLVGQTDEAFAAAQELLNPPRGHRTGQPTDDVVVDQFVEAAHRLAAQRRFDEAKEILVNLRKLLGPSVKPEVAQRIALLEAELAGSTTPVAAEGEAQPPPTLPVPAVVTPSAQ
jgi:hypothetical protein